MTETDKIKEMFEAWLKWYMRDGPDDYLFCDEDMEAAYRKGQRDLLSTLEPSLYQNIDKPHLTWSADNFKLLNIDKKEWGPLFKLPEVGE